MSITPTAMSQSTSGETAMASMFELIKKQHEAKHGAKGKPAAKAAAPASKPKKKGK
jgi:hypothetical protein